MRQGAAHHRYRQKPEDDPLRYFCGCRRNDDWKARWKAVLEGRDAPRGLIRLRDKPYLIP